jgi:hypothetical protein
MPTTLPFAERSVDLVKPTGERVHFRVEFGPIYPASKDFRCKVCFHGWGNSPPDICGYDSLQALLLAVDLVYGILADFIERGGRIFWPGTSEDYDLDAWRTHFNEPGERD